MISLADKVIWITGASSGIGEALAFELGRRGAVVALSARRNDILESIASKIISSGGRAATFPADVGDRAALNTVVAAIHSWHGPIDIVIANAGTHIPSYPQHFDADEYLGLMATNYGGMIHTLAAVVPNFVARKAGHIVGVASLAGFRGAPSAAAYGASKAAMILFLESARFHLAPKGIRVSIVNPGFVKTPLTDKNHFFMPFLISAERAAQIICDGIERERNEMSFPFPFSWMLKLGRIIPYPLYARIVGYACRDLLNPKG